MRNFGKRYVCVKQHDITDCGAACIATISKQYGLKIPITKIREVAGIDKQGINALGMIKATKGLGFSTKAVKDLPEHLNEDLLTSCIAHVVIDG